jgi:hypothetical protein
MPPSQSTRARTVQVPAIPAHKAVIPAHSIIHTAAVLCRELRISHREIADYAGVAEPGVNRSLNGQISASANVRRGTMQAFRNHGFGQFTEAELFDA